MTIGRETETAMDTATIQSKPKLDRSARCLGTGRVGRLKYGPGCL